MKIFLKYLKVLIGGLLIWSCTASEINEEIILSPPGILPIVNQTLEMTFMLSNVTQLDKEWQNNDASLLMEEITGIKVHYDLVQNLAQARMLAISSNDMPDVFMGYTESSDIMTNGPAGHYLPLNNLIEQHAPTIKMNFEEYPQYKKSITTPDGTIYGLPSINDDLHGGYGPKMWINRIWLETLDMKMPETTEEFRTVLKAFKDKDPNRNGIKDEIPWTGARTGWLTEIPGALLNSFLYVNSNSDGMYLENGQIRTAYTDTRYREALSMTSQLYSEGLLDPMAMTQSQQELMNTAEKEGENILGVVNSGYWGIFTKNGGPSGRYKEYDLLPPLKGPEGVQTSAYSMTITKDSFVLSSSCVSPEAAIKWADYIATPEGAWNTQFGREGSGWIRPPKGAIGLNGKPALFIRLNPQETNANWGFDPNIPRFQPVSQRLGEMRAAPEEYYEASKLMTRLTSEVINKYVPFKPPEEMILPLIYLSAEETTLLNPVIEKINEYIKKSKIGFISGGLNIETEWDQYLYELDLMGLQKVLDVYQTAYNRQFGS